MPSWQYAATHMSTTWSIVRHLINLCLLAMFWAFLSPLSSMNCLHYRPNQSPVSSLRKKPSQRSPVASKFPNSFAGPIIGIFDPKVFITGDCTSCFKSLFLGGGASTLFCLRNHLLARNRNLSEPRRAFWKHFAESHAWNSSCRPWLASDLWLPFCLNLPSIGITGLIQHTWLALF